MTTFLPKEVQDGLEKARNRDRRQKSRLRVAVDEFTLYPVLDFRDGGFALDIVNAPKLRGLVDLYEGSRHLYRCLIVASEADGDLMRYEFKQATAAIDKAPLDFAREPTAPVALLEG
ncbi:MAG: hypothetical protein KDK53_04110 [Maritimibacter sp.]|nr:hypothetical protein [Maritimibacter sp.]